MTPAAHPKCSLSIVDPRKTRSILGKLFLLLPNFYRLWKEWQVYYCPNSRLQGRFRGTSSFLLPCNGFQVAFRSTQTLEFGHQVLPDQNMFLSIQRTLLDLENQFYQLTIVSNAIKNINSRSAQLKNLLSSQYICADFKEISFPSSHSMS